MRRLTSRLRQPGCSSSSGGGITTRIAALTVYYSDYHTGSRALPPTRLRARPSLLRCGASHILPLAIAQRASSTTTTPGAAPHGDAIPSSEDASDLLWDLMEDANVSSHATANASSSSPSSQPSASTATPPGAGDADTTRSAVNPEQGETAGQEESTYAHDMHNSGSNSSHDAAAATSSYATAPPVAYVWVALHNMPRNWLHEDIVEFIHQVAKHAGIPPPAQQQQQPGTNGDDEAHQRHHNNNNNSEGEEEDDNAVGHVTSPFVHRLHIPFGRRTGLVYGTPKLLLSSAALAQYVTKHLTFDPDDFRSRIYFTTLAPSEVPAAFRRGHADGTEEHAASSSSMLGAAGRVQYTAVEESLEAEQQEALRTLDLDRYLFAPDLLLDIAKMHQRRLVTKNEKVLLDAFVDGEEDEEAEDEEDDENDDEKDRRGSGSRGEDGMADGDEDERYSGDGSRRSASSARRRRRGTAGKRAGTRKGKTGRATRVRAGTQKHLGRGSMHNMPIPKPYVAGRRL